MYHGKDLAGTCGIPSHASRIYIEVEESFSGYAREYSMPSVVVWGDGRRFKVKAVQSRRTYGREVFGNLVERFDVEIGSHHSYRTLWRDSKGWFVEKPGASYRSLAAISR